MLQEFMKKRRWGNDPCMANVISHVLGVPREGVPNFSHHEDFWMAVDSYLYSWGLEMRPFDPDKHSAFDKVIHYGTNESGREHVVVCDTRGKLLYDSFSIGGSLKGEIDQWVIYPYKTGVVDA